MQPQDGYVRHRCSYKAHDDPNQPPIPSLFSSLLGPLLCVVAGLLATVYGLFTTNWEVFGAGLLTVVITPLAVIAAVLCILGLWLSLLFMPCTPAYVVLWFVVGLPFTCLGAYGGGAPTVKVIVIIKS